MKTKQCSLSRSLSFNVVAGVPLSAKTDRNGLSQSLYTQKKTYTYTYIYVCSTYLYTFSIDISRPRLYAFALFVFSMLVGFCMSFNFPPSQRERETLFWA